MHPISLLLGVGWLTLFPSSLFSLRTFFCLCVDLISEFSCWNKLIITNSINFDKYFVVSHRLIVKLEMAMVIDKNSTITSQTSSYFRWNCTHKKKVGKTSSVWLSGGLKETLYNITATQRAYKNDFQNMFFINFDFHRKGAEWEGDFHISSYIFIEKGISRTELFLFVRNQIGYGNEPKKI